MYFSEISVSMTLIKKTGVFQLLFNRRLNGFFALKKKYLQLCLYRNNVTSSTSAAQDVEYVGVIGLEVHAQINVKSKLFSCSPTTYGSPTNTNVSYFDAAFPGTLPILNKCCVESGILTALALKCKIHDVSRFDRKHYFYPDLPPGFQITQQFYPLASEGHINFVVHDKDKGSYKCCSHLKQLQLEQDSGKSLHVKGQKSLIDLNRAGIGLMELVFEPDLRNGTEAAALIKELVLILKRLGTCSCEMETGALRVDVNVSVHKPGDPFGTRTEVKNINSFRDIAKAVDFEIQRQTEILQKGDLVVNETRAYDYNSKSTVFMRDKEVLQDYRFSPEPNLPPINLSDKGINIEELKSKLPLFPDAERSKLMETYAITLEVADKLVSSEGLSNFFECVSSYAKADPLFISQILFTLVQAELNARDLSFRNCDLSVKHVAELIDLIAFKEISEATAYDILQMLLNGDSRSCKEIVQQYNWFLISDHKELEKLCFEVIAKYSRVAKRYKKTQKKYDMTTLLVALNEKVHQRASISDAEVVFKKLLLNESKDSSDSKLKSNE